MNITFMMFFKFKLSGDISAIEQKHFFCLLAVESHPLGDECAASSGYWGAT